MCPCGEGIDGAPPDEPRDTDLVVSPREPRGFEEGYGLDGYHASVPADRTSLAITVIALGFVVVVASSSFVSGGWLGLGVIAAMASIMAAAAWGILRTLPELLALLPIPIRITVDANRLRLRRGSIAVDVLLDQVSAVRARFARKAKGGSAFARSGALVVDCGDRGKLVMPLGLGAAELEYVARRIEQARIQRGMDPALGYRGHTGPRVRVEPMPASGEHEEVERAEEAEDEAVPENEPRRARSIRRR